MFICEVVVLDGMQSIQEKAFLPIMGVYIRIIIYH